MISTKNIKENGSSSSVSKTLSPGNASVKIYNIRLEATPYNKEAFNIILDVEGPALGDDFEGFYIDKDNPGLGRHDGQVGRVKLTEYPFADGITPKGNVIKRDEEILKAIKNLCNETGSAAWLDSQDEKHDTVDSLINQFNYDKPFANKFLRVCIAGKEYQNKAGYTNHDLYFPKWSKDGIAYEGAHIDEVKSKVVKFNTEVHIKKSKTVEVKTFGEGTTKKSLADDFEL
jgi:hypothetical protein